ncbi:hypothetical protein U3A58_12455 [Algoriphagus sp. C2-6-M1]|uniref:hypothetical protein n=1 Tax=Algoriphagus persicinus TaxID=3108754 RepID=UPI002B3AEBDA|nr:hypothetical protein [Algoriphagus sp. C2-6-M1]MEB2781207.1 hypothetical protein [Algoriphagus sp. C2-6-M1]
MKSSMFLVSCIEMIIYQARFSRSAAADGTGYPVSFVTGQVMTSEKQLKYMKPNIISKSLSSFYYNSLFLRS